MPVKLLLSLKQRHGSFLQLQLAQVRSARCASGGGVTRAARRGKDTFTAQTALWHARGWSAGSLPSQIICLQVVQISSGRLCHRMCGSYSDSLLNYSLCWPDGAKFDRRRRGSREETFQNKGPESFEVLILLRINKRVARASDLF